MNDLAVIQCTGDRQVQQVPASLASFRQLRTVVGFDHRSKSQSDVSSRKIAQLTLPIFVDANIETLLLRLPAYRASRQEHPHPDPRYHRPVERLGRLRLVLGRRQRPHDRVTEGRLLRPALALPLRRQPLSPLSSDNVGPSFSPLAVYTPMLALVERRLFATAL